MKSTLICLLVMPNYKSGDPAPEGYLQWHEWARVQQLAGLRQKACRECGRWLYPQERAEHAAMHATTAIALDALTAPASKDGRG